MELKGKAALVTGGGVGAGRAIALALARAGCDVAVNYSKSAGEAEAAASEARALGVRAEAVQADVRDDTAVGAMTKAVADRFGRLDVLVNNAVVTRMVTHADLEAVTDEVWDFIFDTNLRGAFYCARAAAPFLRSSTSGVILNVSSIAGVHGVGSSIPYCASKAALNNMTVTLARALAPEIRVNAIAPGYIDTRWWQDRDNYEAGKQAAAAATPLGRVCSADDVASVALGLITADMVTGQVLVIDGGMTIGRGLPAARR
jgi:3-oxoacyl-[acyl-carrier protein] reductase